MKEVLGIVICGVVFAAFLKSVRPEWSTLLSLSLSAAVLCLSLPYLRSVTELLRTMAERAEGNYLAPLFKAVGVAVLFEIAVDVCRDAGESALGSKVEFFGKLLLLTMALPVMSALIDLVTELANGM